MKKIENYNLQDHTNRLYKEEASSSIALAHEIAKKINELIDAYNTLAKEDLEWKQTQEGTIRKGVLYMKDNLLNSLNDLMVMLRDSGFIDDRIEYHCNYLKERLDNLIKSNPVDGELIDLRMDLNGKTYSTAGEMIRTQFGALPVGRKAIEDGDSRDLNDYTNAGSHVFTIYDGFENAPDLNGRKPRYLVIEGFGEKIPDLGYIQTWGRQLLYTENGEQVFKRYFKWNYKTSSFDFEEWKHENTNNNFKIITGGDLNNICEVDNYIVATGDMKNAPFAGRGFLMEIKNFSHGWLIQEVTGLTDFRERWYRIGNNTNQEIHTNNSDNLTIKWSDWENVATKSNIKTILGSIDTTQTNKGYKIVNMGDSIFGNVRDVTSISELISLNTGAEVHNFGIGGTRMGKHNYQWDAFSMYNLANAIASGDFSLQENYANEGFDEMPSYLPDVVNEMKNMDWTTVDIITINHGVNDITGGNSVEGETTTSYQGALEHTIKTIMSKYPNIRILVITPTQIFTGDYDEKEILVNNKCKEISEKYSLQYVDTFKKLGVNSLNSSHWFTDGIHPSEEGRKALAKLISNTIKSI
jgi:lysophospholipase L1-like esterase